MAQDQPPRVDQSSVSRPPFDPAYQRAHGPPGPPQDLNLDAMREFTDSVAVETILDQFEDLVHTELTIPAIKDLDENHITISMFKTRGSTKRNRATILYIHGGGQVLGNRFLGVEQFFKIFPLTDDVVFASVEYRLAPAHQAPAGTNDCYAALVYLSEHAEESGLDASKIMIYGVSGGAAPAAATCLLARKRQHPPILAQVLSLPMLDDREYISAKQFESGTGWTGRWNRQAWWMVLGLDRDSKVSENVDEILVPGRATDLSNLPPAFIDVGECEVFRDSAVAYASQIWRDGGTCELHVWPGMYHSAMLAEPEPFVSRIAAAVQKDYIERALGLKKQVS